MGCRRVVLFPYPSESHQYSMLHLADILHSKGFSVSIISTRFKSLKPADHRHFTFHFIDDGLSESEASMTFAVPLIAILNRKSMEPFKKCLSDMLLSNVSEEPISCLIADAFWHFSQDVADQLEIPRIAVWTANITSFVALTILPVLRERGYVSIQREDTRLEEELPELPALRVKDVLGTDFGNLDELYMWASSLVEETKAASGLIVGSFEELEELSWAKLHREFSIPIFPLIQLIHYQISASLAANSLIPDQSSISWLDTQAPRSVLYVSFGSIAAIDGTQFLEIAWGLANTNQPFLWVVRPGLVQGSTRIVLPDEFVQMTKTRGRIIEWAPQQEVLAHPSVGGFWTHNGWISTLESISCGGVPMLSFPLFGDQMINSRQVCEVWRIGVRLEKDASRREIEKAVRRLMVEKEGEEMRERAACWKELASRCTVEGGSSYKYLRSLEVCISSF